MSASYWLYLRAFIQAPPFLNERVTWMFKHRQNKTAFCVWWQSSLTKNTGLSCVRLSANNCHKAHCKHLMQIIFIFLLTICLFSIYIDFTMQTRCRQLHSIISCWLKQFVIFKEILNICGRRQPFSFSKYFTLLLSNKLISVLYYLSNNICSLPFFRYSFGVRE